MNDDLRAAAQAATRGELDLTRYITGGGRLSQEHHLIADFYNEADREFYALASPDRILALLDRLDEYGGLIDMVEKAKQKGWPIHVATRETCAEHLEKGDDKAPGFVFGEPAPSSMTGGVQSEKEPK